MSGRKRIPGEGRAGVAEYYDRTYHRVHHAHLMGNQTYYAARARMGAEFYFAPEERGLRIFEYGCGTGQQISALPNAEGWDISADAREFCLRQGLRVHESIEAVPTGAFDIVFCRHVLEHVENPLATLELLRTLLADGGYLYLVLPKEKHWNAPLRPDENQHLHCWNFRTINNLLFRAGFLPLLNEYRYPLGWKAFLPVYERLGWSAYYNLTRIGASLRRNGELLVKAKPLADVAS